HGDLRGRQWAPGVAGRGQVLFRGQRPLPGDLLAGVRGHAPEDGGHRTLDHVVAVVQDLAGPQAGEQLVVLGLEGVVLPAGVLPNDVAGEVVNSRFFEVTGPLRARDPGRNVAGPVLLLAAAVQVLAAVVVVVGQGVVVEDLAAVRVGRRAEAPLQTAQSDRRRRRLVAHGPQPLVDAVHGLLDDV